VTILSVKEGAGSSAGDPVVRIGLSDGSLFSFKPVYADPVLGPWNPGRELSAGEEGALRFAAACYRTEKLALRLTARAEQCGWGLARKLERRGQGGASVRAVLARLMDLGIVDDRRYAERWLRSRLGRGLGTPRRLEAGLRGRGIDRETAGAALRGALDFEGELALLEGYLARKRLVFDGEDRSLKYRLKAEGFSTAALDRYREERE
jgi:regulatory protein